MSTFANLMQLANSFFRDVELARQLESSNPEDDLVMKTSIVGFSYNSPTQEWDKGHYEFVKARLERDYHDKELAEYGGNVKLFFALGVGYLLGLYHQGKINDSEFKQAEQQIPGLIMYFLPQLTERAC